MTIKIAINGPGRIGRNFIWTWSERKKAGKTDIDIVAINGVRDVENEKGLKYFIELLKFDSTYGHHFDNIKSGRDDNGAWVEIENSKIYLYNNRGDLSELPWNKHNVDVVIESTGLYRKREQAEGHLKAGAKKVLLSAPGKDGIDTSVVLGVAEDIPSDEKIIDCGSCTTNAIASVVKTINDNWGLERGFMITVHAPTDDQRILDASHSDIRRARSLLNNIIPTSTGAAKAVAKIIPELSGKLDGVAMRIPGVTTGSIVGLVADVGKDVTKEEINDVFEDVCKGSLKGILGCADNEIVSSHIIGRKESGIIDLPLTNVINGKQITVWSWYDNERGYANRLVDVAEKFGKQ